MSPSIILYFSKEELQQLLSLLAKLPYEQSAGFIVAIRGEAERQLFQAAMDSAAARAEENVSPPKDGE
jgi:hypothetical protein